MKLTVALLLSLLQFSSFALVQPIPLKTEHPFRALKTQSDFSSWCEQHNLVPFAVFFQERSDAELTRFLQTVPRVLHSVLGSQLVIERAENVLSSAGAANPADLAAAVESIYLRAQRDLEIYHPIQRAYYNYALAPGVVFPEDRTLSTSGKLQMVMVTWQLPLEAINSEFVKASFALDIVAMDPLLGAFTSEERTVIETWAGKHQQILAERYAGHNSQLKGLSFTELRSNPRPRRGTIDDFVQDTAFMDKDWWFFSSNPVPGETGGATDLRATYSRSLVRLFGKDATRVVFWPKEDKVIDPLPVLGQIHIAVNYDGKRRMRSVEVLAKDASGEVQPFMYEKVRVGYRDAWLPVQTFGPRKIPIKQICMNCHGDRIEDSMSSKPIFLRAAEDFREDGYRSDYIISELLRL